MKQYKLVSKRDGEVVAEAVEFSSGTVVVNWQRADFPNSTVVWNCIEDAKKVHEGIGNWSLERVV